MIVYNDGWASASFSVVGDHKNSEDDHNDSEDSHHGSEDYHHDSEHENGVDRNGLFLSKSSSPLTGDTGADDVPMYLLLLLFSLVSIVVALRTQCMQIGYFHYTGNRLDAILKHSVYFHFRRQ